MHFQITPVDFRFLLLVCLSHIHWTQAQVNTCDVSIIMFEYVCVIFSQFGIVENFGAANDVIEKLRYCGKQRYRKMPKPENVDTKALPTVSYVFRIWTTGIFVMVRVGKKGY